MTASGVVFLTLEDETGFINVVLWSRVFEEYRYVATQSALLHVKGRIERGDGEAARTSARPIRDDDVVYIVAKSLAIYRMKEASTAHLPSMSRDFH
jgi:DNA polymerase III alpha subunit